MTRVLIVDDEESICWGLAQLCSQMSLESDIASSAEKGLELAKDKVFDVIVMDVRLPGIDGLTAIERFHQQCGKIPVITITAFGDLSTAIEAVQKGAFEYVVKPFELDTMQKAIEQAIATSQILSSSRSQGDDGPAKPRSNPLALVGSSAIMQEVYKQIALATTTDSPVLVTGESGTGKELTVRSIHRFGARKNEPFIAVNIAALSPSLAESELFGHVKGAFTGADSDRQGLIQHANGGTLFLDEIAEIPLELQVKLLRVLETGEVTPVGSNIPVKSDFRLISATHQDLLSQINHGEFRLDLFYRLRTIEIQLPPLRQRKTDMPELVDHFLCTHHASANCSVSSEFIAKLKEQSWPGNVRELQSVVDRAVTIVRNGVLTADHVERTAVNQVDSPARKESLNDEIQSLIAEWTRQNWSKETGGTLYESLMQVIDPAVLSTAFELSDSQYSAAARTLGIHRTTLKKKLDQM